MAAPGTGSSGKPATCGSWSWLIDLAAEAVVVGSVYGAAAIMSVACWFFVYWVVGFMEALCAM